MNDDKQLKKMLEVVRSFQEEFTLTPEEASAFDENAPKPRPKVEPKKLPIRGVISDEGKSN